MPNSITLFDYNADWALKENFIDPRSNPGYLTREEVLAFFGASGVDGAELSDDYWADCSAAQLRQLASDAGLPIFSYIFNTDLAVPADQRRAVVDRVRSMLDRTVEMGARFAFVLPLFTKQGLPLDEQRAWLVEGLQECAEYAGSIGVRIIFENCDWAPIRPLMSRGKDCVNICRAVGSPHFRLACDVGAPIFVEEDPLATVREMIPYSAHVHLKNFRPVGSEEKVQRYIQANNGQRYAGTRLDVGIIDITTIVSQLRRMNYNGSLLVEYQGEEDPRPALEHNLEYLRRVLGEKKGTVT